MKKFFTLFVVLVASMGFCFAQQSSSSEKTFIEIDRRYVNTGDQYERSLFMPNVEAYYYPVTGDVEFELYEIGEADVYIVDSSGNIVDETVVDTDVPITIFLDASSCAGYFYVVVCSDFVYAEGVVPIE